MNAETAGEQKWLRQKTLTPRELLDVLQVKAMRTVGRQSPGQDKRLKAISSQQQNVQRIDR